MESILMWTQHWRATEQTQDVQKPRRQRHSGYTNLHRRGPPVVCSPTCGSRILWFLVGLMLPHSQFIVFSVSVPCHSFHLLITTMLGNRSFAIRFWRVPNWPLSGTS